MGDISDRREQVRRLIVNLIFVIYWLLIFEGALRKWMFPAYHKYIFFIKDPIVLLVYWIAFLNRMWPKKTPMFTAAFSLAVVFLLFALLQCITTDVGIATLIYGWRMYFFYLPLAFIIGEQFRGEDLKRLVRHTLLIAIPIAMLVYRQYISPPSAFVNRTAGGGGVIYTITGKYGGGIVRPTGTFTFFHGQQLFIGSIIAFVFTSWVLPLKERPLSNKILLLAGVAVLVNLVLSGTRLPFMLAVLICLATALSGSIMRGQRMSFRAKIFPIILVIIGTVFFITVFTTTYEITLRRHRAAERTEGSVVMRGVRMLYAFADFVSATPVLGTGIGSQTSGGTALVTGTRGWGAGVEDEWSRIIVETGPIFGSLYIFLRISLVIWLFKYALRATRRSNNPLPLLLLAFIGVIVLMWNITNYGSENGYGWLFTGFCIAANNLGQRMTEEKRDAWS